MSKEKALQRAHLLVERSVELKRFRKAYPGSDERFREIEKIAPDELKPILGHVLELMNLPDEDDDPALSQFFGFTGAEAKLATFLMAGGSLSSFAKENGISRNTARNQLQVIFQKTNVRRQAELVALLRDTVNSLS